MRSAPEDTSRALVEAALEAGSTDNCTALVLDVVALPTARSADVGSAIMRLPLIPMPQVGDTVDGFVLNVAGVRRPLQPPVRRDRRGGGRQVVLKFPKPQVAAVATYHAAFVREAWVGTRVHSPWVAHVIELPPGRQTCLYTVMPLYQASCWRPGWRARRRWAWRRAAPSRSGSRTRWRRCTAPASSTATSSRTT